MSNSAHKTRKFLSRISQPAEEPITADYLRDHGRIDDDDELAAAAKFIPTARDVIEGAIGRTTTQSVWEIAYDAPIAHLSYLPLKQCPIVSVASFKYYTEADIEQTFSPSLYVLDDQQGRIFLKQGSVWPVDLRQFKSVVVRFTAGYASDEAVPPSIKQAIAMLACHYYENREAFLDRPGAFTIVPMGIMQLLSNYNENVI